MTLYTLDKYLRTSMVYLSVSIALATFGAVYEVFSHGVFSFYMIYAFMIPLIGGAVHYMAAYLAARRSGPSDKAAALRKGSGLYHAAIATLTIGSIMKGVLDIYGTTNRLIVIYPAVGAILLITAAAMIRRT